MAALQARKSPFLLPTSSIIYTSQPRHLYSIVIKLNLAKYKSKNILQRCEYSLKVIYDKFKNIALNDNKTVNILISAFYVLANQIHPQES